jgi:hypothetical protein
MAGSMRLVSNIVTANTTMSSAKLNPRRGVAARDRHAIMPFARCGLTD